MEEVSQYLSRLGKGQGGPDTSKQMFDMVDDLGANFKEEFELAKTSQSTTTETEKVSPKSKKSSSSPEEKEEAPEVSSAPEKIEPEEKAIPKDAIEEEGSLPVQPAEVQEEQPEETEAIKAKEKSEGATPIAEVVQPPDDEIKVQATDEEVKIAEASKPEEELEATAQKNPKNITIDQAAQTTNPEATIVANIEAEKSNAVSPIEDKSLLQQKKPILPQVIGSSAENPAEEAEEADISNKSDRSADLPSLLIDSDEAESLLNSLQKTADQTQVQAPALDRVSTRVLEALKTTNGELARQVQGIRIPKHLAAPQANPRQYQPLNTVKSEQPQQPRNIDPHLEKLKAKVMDQIRVKIRVLTEKNQGEIQIKLKPRLLGDIKIHLKIDEAQAKGAFIVENNSVRELLQRSMPELKESLAEHGIDTDVIDVNVADDFQGDTKDGKAFASIEDQEAAREWIGSFRKFGDDEDPEEATTEGKEDSDQVLNVVV